MANTIKAAKSVYKAGGEHYHFNVACDEHGEKAVLDAMRDGLKQESGLTHIDATYQACIEFKMMQRLEQGENRFKQIRFSLDADKVNNRHDTFEVVPV